MTKKIAVTTSSFAQQDAHPLEILKKHELNITLNERGRTLKQGEILELLKGCHGVIAGTEIYNKEVLGKLKDLRVISRCGVGTDNIDLEICKNLEIKVFNTPDGPTRAVAELVIGLILNLLRQVNVMDREVRSGVWQKRMGRLFADKEIGIIGLGRVGREVAQLSNAFGAKVFYYDSFQTQDSNFPYAIKNKLEDLLSHCDIISLHIPFTPETKHFIGRKELSLMRKSAIVINCSRGGIVDEEALYFALKNGNLFGAAIDVFDSEPYQGPLWGLKNVILTPHIGSYAQETRLKMELTAVDNLIKGLRGAGLS